MDALLHYCNSGTFIVLSVITNMLTKLFVNCSFIKVYANLHNHRASEAPQVTIPPSPLLSSSRPDIVVHNSQAHSIALLGLTRPLDLVHHLESAWNSKQSKVEYLQLLTELDRLNINYYETIEILSLGHYQPASIRNFLNYINFSNLSTTVPKSEARRYLDDAAFQSILASERIF